MKNFIIGCLVVVLVGFIFYTYITNQDSVNDCFVDNGKQFVPLPYFDPSRFIHRKTELCLLHG